MLIKLHYIFFHTSFHLVAAVIAVTGKFMNIKKKKKKKKKKKTVLPVLMAGSGIALFEDIVLFCSILSLYFVSFLGP